MLQGSCPSRTAPFFTLHIPADINSLWLLSALEFLNLEVACRKKKEQPHGCPSPKTFQEHTLRPPELNHGNPRRFRGNLLWPPQIAWCVINW